MKRKILQIGNKKLYQKSTPIKNFSSPELQKIIDEIIETCIFYSDQAAGLAAPQIGKNINLTVIRRLDKETQINEKNNSKTKKKLQNNNINNDKKNLILEPILNPRVISLDREEESTFWEACMSVGKGDKQLWGPVKRPLNIEIEYEDRHGKTKTHSFKNFMSHLIQHEIDHLNGILFINKVINPDKNIWTNEKFEKYIQNNTSYPDIK